jgi:DNA repair photolyase
MLVIYEPKGKAREYSPLAVNLYTGCGHKCNYCYVPRVLKMTKLDFDNKISGKLNIIARLEKELSKYQNSNKQVLMSFSTDPYNPFDEKFKLTRIALILFLKYRIPIAILTKSGKKALRDMDIIEQFGKHIKIGASLTYDNITDSRRIESSAALPNERMEALRLFHENNIKTWISFEPIMSPEQTLNLLKQTIKFTDEYQLGKLANDKRDINWTEFLQAAITILRENKKGFYIKNTLRQSAPNIILNEHESDQNYLTLKSFEKQKLIFD